MQNRIESFFEAEGGCNCGENIKQKRDVERGVFEEKIRGKKEGGSEEGGKKGLFGGKGCGHLEGFVGGATATKDNTRGRCESEVKEIGIVRRGREDERERLGGEDGQIERKGGLEERRWFGGRWRGGVRAGRCGGAEELAGWMQGGRKRVEVEVRGEGAQRGQFGLRGSFERERSGRDPSGS